MVVLQKDITYRPGDIWNVVFFGDIHFGATMCDEVLLNRFVGMYKEKPNTLICEMGDEIDAIVRGDKRYDPLAVAPQYRNTRNMIDLVTEDLSNVLKPIRGKIVCGVDSNHNASYRRASEVDPHYRLSESLRFVRMGVAGDLILNWRAAKKGVAPKTTHIHLAHGNPAVGASPGAVVNVLHKDASIFMANILAEGHTHRLSVPEPRRWFAIEDGHRKVRVQYVCSTGSFVKSYSDTDWSPYTEVKRVSPAGLGWVVCEIWLPSYEEKPHLRLYTEEWSGWNSREAQIRR